MPAKIRRSPVALAAIAVAVSLFTTGCDSGMPYSASNPIVYDYWYTPNPSWRFTPLKPRQSCGAPGHGRKIVVSNRGNYVTYREVAVNPANFKISQVRVTRRPGPASSTLYHAYENGYNRHAIVRGCDNTGLLGEGHIYLARAKVSRSVTWQCQGSICGPRQHGSWVSGWR